MLIFIGTLHCNRTRHDELIMLIESFKPSQVLIEIAQEDIDNNSLEKYPDEMRATLAWAIDNHIDIHGIDSSVKTLKEGISDEDLRNLDAEQTAITSKHDWKKFNRPEFFKVLETKTWHKIIDKTKDDERNLEMYTNITRQISRTNHATTVIVTGSGHIPFFMGKFSDAQFPLS